MGAIKRVLEDPSINDVCALEANSLWELIEGHVAEGMSFYRARELVLAQWVPDIRKAYGTTVALRVSDAIMRTGMEKLSPHCRASRDAADRRLIEESLIRRKGRVTLMDRICLALIGQAWS